MNGQRVVTSFKDGVAHVRMSRPKQHNGIDFDMLHAVIREARALRKRCDVRAVILHGEGESFCAGLDFKTVLSQPVRELVSMDVAKELVFSGRVVRGDEAKALGLVSHVADDPLAAAEALAAEFMARSPDSVASSHAVAALADSARIWLF